MLNLCGLSITLEGKLNVFIILRGKHPQIVSVTESLRLYCFSLATWWKDLVLSWCDLYTRRG